MRGPFLLSIILTLCLYLTPCECPAAAPDPSIAAEGVDPASVQRYGPAYRYPRAGWIVVHIEGSPYDRGYQHGRLLAPEIADYVKTLATKRSHAAPADAWRETRTMVNALFLRRYDPEYLEEMKGIADGAAAGGATFQGRPLDLLDVVTVNSDIELEFLDSALDATATGLEGRNFRAPAELPRSSAPPEHCSAFAANGPATADGKVVIGHITMFSLTFVRHFNIWLDVKPDKGHRVLMQTYPGGIQSGMDYYLNDAGMVVAETTIKQTKFDIEGKALASRIRKALQYADSIDAAVEVLKSNNNGMYTNEWLLADTKTNEIAMFELGTRKSKLWRSSKDEWFVGTKGFYWGCNNAKDLDVRLETVASTEGRPANVVYHPTDRDRTWLRLYEKHKGKIAAGFGFEAFTTPPLAAAPSCDAKFTTTDLARELKTWALFGPPMGRTWEPSDFERKRYADVQPLVGNDWTLLTARSPDAAPMGDVVAERDARAEQVRNQRRIDLLKQTRDQQLAEVEGLRRKVNELTRKLSATFTVRRKDRAAWSDFARRWDDQLTRIRDRITLAKDNFDQLKASRPRVTRPADDEAIERAINDPFKARPEVQLRFVDFVTVARNPKISAPKAWLKDLGEKQEALKKAVESRLKQLAGSSRRVQSWEQSVRDAERVLSSLDDQETTIRSRVEQVRAATRIEGDEVRVESARHELQRAEAVLDQIETSLAQYQFEAKTRPSANINNIVGRAEAPKTPAVDLENAANPKAEPDDSDAPLGPYSAAWHGTLLPKSEADTWLAASFADYEAIVARENAYKARAKSKNRELTKPETEDLAVAMFAPYSRYRAAVARLGKDVPLVETRPGMDSDEWYQIASNKGVLLLSALRRRLGDGPFFKLMDGFGRRHAGRTVSTQEFRDAAAEVTGDDLTAFFGEWMTGTDLPGVSRAPFWSIHSYEAELDRTVIVYGTLKESDAQREAAGRLQRKIERAWSNKLVPILSDHEASPQELKGRHVLLVGRPDSNSAAARLASALPLTFGPASFVVRGETYAHPKSAVIAAGPNPDDPSSEVVVFAGLSAEATWRCVHGTGEKDSVTAEVLILPAIGKARKMVVGEPAEGSRRTATR